MDLQLKERIVLITGGSIGIGYAVAEAFASEGAHVVTCARDEERLNESVKTLQVKYPQSEIFAKQTDVSKLEDIEALVQFVEEQFNGLDILVNNAGTGSAEKNMTASDEKWYHYWDLHVMAAVRLARLCVPLMRRREGESVIIHTASICATQPLDYEPIYNVTKAALVMYSKCLANELIPENIRVNTISPGLIRTPDWDKTAAIVSKEKGLTPDEYLTNIAKENAPIGRFASAEELAQFYLFLCSPQASYCVGSNYYVDGGWLKVIS
jgi:NAD(P)-dependent dehydrogenase (short-subunit alcohol dehydrogenase family)